MMKQINKPVWLWIAGLCMLFLVAILVNQVIKGTEKIILSIADQIILLTLAGGMFLSWHISGETKMKLEEMQLKHKQ